MSREIKFRAWNEEKGIMMLPGSVDLFIHFDGTINHHDLGIVQGSNNTPQMMLMQYTGLKDKNGKEIYEGDIVQGEHAIYSIHWDGRMAQFKAKVEQTKSVLIRHNSFPLWQYIEDDGRCRCEVIGNIYENPSLLGEKGEGQK